MNKKLDAFEKYEKLPKSYYKDPRWKEVSALRKSKNPDDILKSNGLVFQIRNDWGFE